MCSLNALDIKFQFSHTSACPYCRRTAHSMGSADIKVLERISRKGERKLTREKICRT